MLRYIDLNSFRSLGKYNVKFENKNSYIKTIICDILGYDTNHVFNQSIGNLYDNYLLEKYPAIAIEESIISPMFENRLLFSNNEERKKIVSYMWETYLYPIVLCVNNLDFEMAVHHFIEMNAYVRRVVNLTCRLDIDDEINKAKNIKVLVKQKSF